MDLHSRTATAASVLVLSPSLATGTDAVCADLLGASANPNVLWIAFGGRPSARIEEFRDHADESPAHSAVITVSEGGTALDSSSLPYDPRVEVVTNPNDLTGLGIAITECLREWEDDAHPTQVCFDSLTSLLQYVEFQTAYEFLHVVSGRTYEMGATIHVHLDPGAHDERTIESVATLCDAIVTVSDHGVDVRTR